MDPANRLEGRPELTERRDLQRPLDGGAEAAVAAFAGHPQAQEWLAQQVALLQPQSVEVCDGSDEEFDRLCALLVQRGVLVPLNPKLRPRSFLARSSPSDVARVESRTFVCSQTRAEAGLTNNWEDPTAMMGKLSQLFQGSMRGRTMYVIPYSMGHPNSPFAKIGIQGEPLPMKLNLTAPLY
jgi:phosphoenolpyruvate carboxykinase (GTP)